MTKQNILQKIPAFSNKIWLSSPTMHGEELQYMQEAYETNWMSTVGANINEVERITCEKIGCGYSVALSSGTAALHLALKLAGERLYGQPAVGHGTLEGRKVFCSDMTFLQQVFGHSSPSVTLRYIGIDDDVVDKSLEDFYI